MLAVMISGRGSNLAAIINARLPVAAVIADNSKAAGLAIARSNNIRCATIERSAFAARRDWEDAIASFIEAADCQLIALAGFMRILSAHFIERFGGNIINLHPSLLPQLPGLDTHARALATGLNEHGCTAHWLTPEVDAGPVIRQVRVPILSADTPETLAARVQEQEHLMFPQVLAEALAKQIRRPT